MSSIRAELWCAAFLRRHNDLGSICVVSRRGDPIAGQVWIEVDHIDGTSSLFTQAPSAAIKSEEISWVFQRRFDRVPNQTVKQRIEKEINFDPDFWLLTLESRGSEYGLTILKE